VASHTSCRACGIFKNGIWMRLGGVDAVFNARGLVCGCANIARKITPLARVIFSESKRAKTHVTHVWTSIARGKHARAIGLGEG